MAMWCRRLTGRVNVLVSAGCGSRMRRWAKWAAASAFLIISASGSAEASDENKSQYTLFNPTPDRLLRDLTTDRPDATETPFTVDAGRVQTETNLFGYARSRPDADGTVTNGYEFATTNIRVGLTHNAEFNVVVVPHVILQNRSPDPLLATRQSGIGGVYLRGKLNLWGNDTFDKPGATALGLLPFLVIPTDRHNGISPEAVEGGVIVPFAVKLSEKFALGINAGVHVLRSDDKPAYHAEYIATASLSYEWTEALSTYYEIAARFNTGNPLGDIAMLATGFTYKLSKNLQFDGGIRFGVTNAADRIAPFVGVSARY